MKEFSGKMAKLSMLTMVMVLTLAALSALASNMFGVLACNTIGQRIAVGASLLLIAVAIKLLIIDPSYHVFNIFRGKRERL